VTGGMELKEVKEKSARVAAFFDLDGTLVALPSLERRFIRMLLYRGEIPVKNNFLWLREAARLALRGISRMLQANKMLLRGIPADQWRSRGLRLAPSFFENGLERVSWHSRNGHLIVLLSGTLEPLAEAAGRAIESELAARGIILAIRICATRLEEVDGTWTGKILGEAMFGEAKSRAAEKIASEMTLDLGHCYAYGDSADDRWLLAAVGRPFAVNPSADLAQFAETLGWPSLSWASKENLTQRHGVCRKVVEKKVPPGMIA
jgi:HAD superfamily hydrolase (TIGR01490 family)